MPIEYDIVEATLGHARIGQPVGLLALARAEASAVFNASAHGILAPALDEAIASVKPLAKEKEITIRLSSAKIEVAGEAHDLAMLFANLVDNAVRYTPPKGAVEIRVEPVGDVVAVEIHDSGPGLPEDMLERVFERFTRHAENGEGTGLGLAIVRAIADRIGAHVSLRNRKCASGLVARVELRSISQASATSS